MSEVLTETTLDPRKRVNYTLGLVLGVDELNQEQTYLMERDRLHNRALHGYGTVSGLALETRPSGADVEVVVNPGMAVDPIGRHICIDELQCAKLNAWLGREEVQEELENRFGATLPATFPIYLTLCYRECKTDQIPIPGGPCKTQEDLRVASRIKDDFELQFVFDRPQHPGEEAVRRLGEILSLVEIAGATDPVISEEDFLDLIRTVDGDPSLPSPPESIFVPAEEAVEYFRSGLRIWVTEVLPNVRGNADCRPDLDESPCLLLGRIDLTPESDGTIAIDGIEIVEDERPYLLSTRVLQERVLDIVQGIMDETLAAGDAAGGDLSGTYPDPRVHGLRGNPIHSSADSPNNGQVLRFQSGQWRAGDLPAETLGAGDAAGGDLTGTYPNPQVQGLQGRPLNAASPSNTQILQFQSGQWQLANLPSTGGGLTLEEIAEQLPTWSFASIHADDGFDLDLEPVAPGTGFRIWFHLNAGPTANEDNVPEIDADSISLKVFGETDQPAPNPPFLSSVGVDEIRRIGRNLVFVRLTSSAIKTTLLRFRFNVGAMRLTDGTPLQDQLLRRPVKWLGHDGKNTITVFHTNEAVVRDRLELRTAGWFEASGEPIGPVLGRPRVRRIPGQRGRFIVTFPNYTPRGRYFIQGTPMIKSDTEMGATFNVVMPFDSNGITVDVKDPQGNVPNFMIQIHEAVTA